MSNTKKRDNVVQIPIYMSPELAAEVRAAAKDEMRSTSGQCVHLIKRQLDAGAKQSA